MNGNSEHEETVVRVVTIIVLGVILLVAVIGIIVVAIFTERDLWKAEALTFAGALVVATVGGFRWWLIRRRHRWHLKLDHNGENDDPEAKPK